MGAGVAAGPHCPVASTLPGRRGVPRWAVSKKGVPSRGLDRPSLPESIAGLKPSPVPPLAPRQGRGPDGSPLGGFGTHVPLPFVSGPFAEASVPSTTGYSAEAFGSPDGHEPKPCSAGFAAPGRSPILPDRSEPKLFSAGGDALTEIPLSPGQVLDPKVRSPAFPGSSSPKALGPGWALHEAYRFRIR